MKPTHFSLIERFVKLARENADRAMKEWSDVEAAAEEAHRQATVCDPVFIEWLRSQDDVDEGTITMLQWRWVYTVVGKRGGEAADRIGCCYSTQAGEMPTLTEVDIRLQRAFHEVTCAGPALRAEKLDALIAMAIFARGQLPGAD